MRARWLLRLAGRPRRSRAHTPRRTAGSKGPAESCGRIQPMDMLVGINGERLRDVTFEQAVRRIQNTAWPMTIEFARIVPGKSVSLTPTLRTPTAEEIAAQATKRNVSSREPRASPPPDAAGAETAARVESVAAAASTAESAADVAAAPEASPSQSPASSPAPDTGGGEGAGGAPLPLSVGAPPTPAAVSADT